ncbi:DHHA2 domain-containing protein [Allobaculum sp. Allo2]|uniref:DHHA2 domain-containing protein n=3 Tax=Allobaculum TaxID=174708 RepID=UPI001F61FEA9|nr:DHHA2 domain-containing protein [Allobaculum sp. Allo2]
MMERDLTGAIMVLNDHEDDMIKAMAKGAAMIVIAEGFVPNDYIFEMAKAMGVTLISTPYNLMKIIQMIYRSIPVRMIMTPKEKAVAFHPSEYLEDVEKKMLQTRHSSYPVVVGNQIVGAVARYHLLKAEPKKFILVDHNESKQSIDDREQGEILEIVDHHRIGDIETTKPIVFRNMIVGSSNTIIALMYQELNIRMDEKIAKLVLYAMISDTMNFKSPTCTMTDQITARNIEQEYGLNAAEMAEDLFRHTATIEGKEFKEILYQDCKEFDLSGVKTEISQVLVFDYSDVERIRDDFEEYMEKEARNRKIGLWVMAFTNVEGSGSHFIAAGPEAARIRPILKEFEELGYVSRKKQFVPGLSAALR